MKRRTLLKLLGAALVATGIPYLAPLGRRCQEYGEISHITYWDRALTYEEVQRLADGGRGRDWPPRTKQPGKTRGQEGVDP